MPIPIARSRMVAIACNASVRGSGGAAGPGLTESQIAGWSAPMARASSARQSAIRQPISWFAIESGMLSRDANTR